MSDDQQRAEDLARLLVAKFPDGARWDWLDVAHVALAEAACGGICGDTAPGIVAGPPLICGLYAGHDGWHEAAQHDSHGFPLDAARWTPVPTPNAEHPPHPHPQQQETT